MKTRPLIFDAHLDLAMNALEWNRDLTQPVAELRAGEQGKTDKPDRANGTVSLPEMRRGGVGLCVATLIARVEHNAYSPVAGWRSQAQAWAQTQGQFAWYRAMEEAGEMVQIRDASGLEKHLALWNESGADEKIPVGYVLSLEGADSILSLDHLARAREAGLSAIGPAHYGPGVYANGTDASGGFNAKGRELVKEMDRLGFILDVTHLCDECFWEALDLFQGPVWASHQNCRAIVPGERQFSDEQIKVLIDRDAVIGGPLDAWMLYPGYKFGSDSKSLNINLEKLVDHFDHVCQLAGNSNHIAFGTDLDGLFGTEQSPYDLDTIADVTKYHEILTRRGYSEGDRERVFSGNWLRVLERVWR